MSIPDCNLGKVPLCAQSVQQSKFRGGHFRLNIPSICGLELLTMTAVASLPLTFAVRCTLGAA